jgi:murein DD-endopeptidase MepM/ murein hydrolase activator NlpD
VLLCALPAAGPVAAASTDRVRAAEDDVEDARGQLGDAGTLAADLSAKLDAAAARYESAVAHQHRLEGEAVELSGQSREAVALAGDAEDAFARQVADAYMRPAGIEIALAGAIVLAPDPGTAMHRAWMIERLTVRERERADRAASQAELASDVERQQAVVQAGVRWAAEDSKRGAEDLELALTAATHRVEEARAALSRAEAEHERVVAEERARLEAERLAAEIAARSSGPLPPVDGKVCPIGGPNAFIDSWGFPRSGGRRHQGVDMFAAHGMALYAVADGVVGRVWNNRLGGLSVDLVDGDGHRYYYAHLSAAAVEPGQRVSAGDVVGANGNSGNARGTPPHLHWQYHPSNGPPVNPYPLARALCR